MTQKEKEQALLNEIKALSGLISGEKDATVEEELKQERTLLIAKLNRQYGTNMVAINIDRI